MTEHVFLLLGGNVGNREDYLAQAVQLLDCSPCRVVKVSSLWESEPWGFECHTWFLNQAVELETALEPLALLHRLQAIEQRLGRVRQHDKRYAARTVDIDIIYFGQQTIELADLIIPHPLMEQRMFVLRPLSELCPTFRHPVNGLTVDDLLAQCHDTSVCKRLSLDIQASHKHNCTTGRC